MSPASQRTIEAVEQVVAAPLAAEVPHMRAAVSGADDDGVLVRIVGDH